VRPDIDISSLISAIIAKMPATAAVFAAVAVIHYR
jgi:hypothetical protein